MHRSIYECDHCKKEIGKKPHISLFLDTRRSNDANGIALPPGYKKNPLVNLWIVKGFGTNFLHFCNGKCIGAFFAEQLKKY